jgi:hypothetical protein
MKIKANDLLDVPGHKFITGMTRSGKTYLALQMMLAWRGPVVFWNPQQEYMDYMYNVNRSLNTKMFVRLISKGCKLGYVPVDHRGAAERELSALLKLVLQAQEEVKNNVLFVIDEAQDYGDTEAAQFIARRGLSRGITGIFTAQSAADVSKVLCRQAEQHIHFQVGVYDIEYYRRYHLPIDEMQRRLKEGGKYSFICVNFAANREYLTGAYKIPA